jgi:hypothetical protein
MSAQCCRSIMYITHHMRMCQPWILHLNNLLQLVHLTMCRCWEGLLSCYESYYLANSVAYICIEQICLPWTTRWPRRRHQLQLIWLRRHRAFAAKASKFFYMFHPGNSESTSVQQCWGSTTIENKCLSLDLCILLSLNPWLESLMGALIWGKSDGPVACMQQVQSWS